MSVKKDIIYLRMNLLHLIQFLMVEWISKASGHNTIPSGNTSTITVFCDHYSPHYDAVVDAPQWHYHTTFPTKTRLLLHYMYSYVKGFSIWAGQF